MWIDSGCWSRGERETSGSGSRSPLFVAHSCAFISRALQQVMHCELKLLMNHAIDRP